MSDVALTICLLSLVAVLGLAIGHIRIRGISLGIGGVLFGGILVGHWLNRYDFVLNEHTLHFIQEFGLILFVYTIGNQVGPGFFASLRHSGLRLNGVAMAIVALSGVLVVALHLGMDVPLGVILGIFSGAVTNTPSLGAGWRAGHRGDGHGLCHCLPDRHSGHPVHHVADPAGVSHRHRRRGP